MKNKVSKFIARSTALALFAIPFSSSSAQEVYSATIGAVAINVPSQSDVMVALPFKQEKLGGGSISSVNGATVTLSSGSMTAGEFDAPNAAGGVFSYYIYVEDGDLEGRYFNISANTESTLTLATTELTGISQASVSIRAHWTLGKLFPDGVGGYEEVEAGLRVIEVIVPELVSVGGGLAANRIFYFYDNGSGAAWREVGKPLSSDLASTVVEPGTAFVIRNNGATDIGDYFYGEVEYGPMAIPLVTADEGAVDNFVAVDRPLGLSINDLQLHSSGVFSTNDRLLVYSMDAGKNKSPAVYYYDGSWKLEGGNGQDVGSDVIEAGQGIAVRKAVGADATTYWVNEWSLSQ